MRRIFPSILSPASGDSPQKEEQSSQDKECLSSARPKSPARSRSPFKWGRSSDSKSSKREHYCPKCPADGKGCETPPSGDENLSSARRLAHPGKGIELDLATPVSRRSSCPGFEDDCEEKQVLSVRACSPTEYFQSAHRMRAGAAPDPETRSTAGSRYKSPAHFPFSPTQPNFRHETPSNNLSKRTKSAPRLRMPFTDPKPKMVQQKSMDHSNPPPAIAMISSLVNWSPGRSRSNRSDSNDNLSTVSTCGSNSFGERRVRDFDDKTPSKFHEMKPKYRGARSVAEKLAKAIRGGGSTKAAAQSPREDKPPASFSERSGVTVHSSFRDPSTRALKSYLCDPNLEADLNDYSSSSEIIMEFPSSRYRRERSFPVVRREPPGDDKECEELDKLLREFSARVDNMCSRAEERVTAAEQQVESVKAELDAVVQSCISDDEELEELDMDAGLESTAVHTKIRNLLQQKLGLAAEAASEARLRAGDQEVVREGMKLVSRRLELASVVSEREKSELQVSLEEELQRREAEWIARLEKAQMEEARLKARVRDIAESNVGLQKEMALVVSREKGLREQIRQFEGQIAGHKKQVDEAERVILEIRESSVSSRKHSMHAEDEVMLLRKRCQEKEEENTDLRRLVSRLQQLCTDHEKSIQGLYNGLKNVTASSGNGEDRERGVVRLQSELCRLSVIEQGLRRELEASNREATSLRRDLKRLVERLKGEQKDGVKPGSEYQSEIEKLKSQMYELQEQNSILSIKLGTAQREEKNKADAVQELEMRKRSMEEEVRSLQEEMGKRNVQLQDKDKDFKWVETRLQAVVKTNRLLQGIVAKQAAFRRKSSEVGGEDTRSDLQKCLEVSAEQLNQMSEKLELLKDKLLERESELFAARTDCGKKDVAIQSLEENLSECKKTLETRIQRLTGRNEELFRLYNAKEKELVELQTRVKEEAEARKKCESELEQVKEQVTDLQEELKVQGMHCVLLRGKLCTREVELEHQDAETKKTVEDSHTLKRGTERLQTLLDEATQRVIGLEHKLAEKEEKITWLQRGLNDRVQDWTKVKEELVRTRKERDAIKQEAEELGREALRTSAEVEVLKRKLHLLEEDILLKEGELSILQGEILQD